MTDPHPSAPSIAPDLDFQSASVNAEDTDAQRVARIHGLGAIALSGLLGGPLAVSYLVHSNLRTLGLRDRMGAAFGILAPLVLLWLYVIYIMPPDFLSQLIPFLPQVVLWSLGARYFLSAPHEKYKEHGGQFRSTWAAVRVGLLTFGVLKITFFVVSQFAIPSAQAEVGQTDVIDAIATKPDRTDATLLLFQLRPWNEESITLFNKKVQFYAMAIGSGALSKQRPETVGKSIRIIVLYQEIPPADVEGRLRELKDVFGKSQVVFIWGEQKDLPLLAVKP
jgi:hypothetical protein